MIKIAFCDDELSVLHDLTVLLDRYRVDRNQEMEYFAYQSPFELMANIEKGHQWDIILLDVMMPGENGIEVAKEIRGHDENVKIIFLSSSPEFAVQSYAVNAYFYQLKPIREENLFPVLDQALASCKKARTEMLVLKCKSGITVMDPAELEYCEVNGRSLLLYMQDGRVLESIGKLDVLEEKLLSTGSFLRVHRSYLVNMAYIQNISYRSVILFSQKEIPIPHGKCGEIKKTYLSYAFERETVLL